MNSNQIPEIDIKQKLPEISKMGFVKSMRKGNTGIGFTLETLMGVKENNLKNEDFTYNDNKVELKAQRIQASSNITLITKSPKWEPLSDAEIIRRYGKKDVKGRKSLKVTLKMTKFNKQRLKLELVKNERLNIINENDGVICYFSMNDLMDKLKQKLSNLLLVIADTKMKGDDEYFHYKEAIYFSRFNETKFMELFNRGLIVWEFRMHIKESGSVRDHGSGFRTNKRNLTELYDNKEVIM